MSVVVYCPQETKQLFLFLGGRKPRYGREFPWQGTLGPSTIKFSRQYFKQFLSRGVLWCKETSMRAYFHWSLLCNWMIFLKLVFQPILAKSISKLKMALSWYKGHCKWIIHCFCNTNCHYLKRWAYFASKFFQNLKPNLNFWIKMFFSTLRT